jgi:hypothetical protein
VRTAGNPAKDALTKFSEARSVLIKEKRNIPEDPGGRSPTTDGGRLPAAAGTTASQTTTSTGCPTPPDRAALINRVVLLLQMRENKADAIQLLLGYLRSDARRG